MPLPRKGGAALPAPQGRFSQARDSVNNIVREQDKDGLIKKRFFTT